MMFQLRPPFVGIPISTFDEQREIAFGQIVQALQIWMTGGARGPRPCGFEVYTLLDTQIQRI